jgi:MFS family permease
LKVESVQSKNLILVVCAVLHGLNHAFQFILPPLYISIKDDFGLDGLSPVMLFGTIYFVTYAAMNLPYGILADRLSKKRILVFGASLNSIAFLVAGTTSTYTIFVVAMVLAGLGGGTYHPVGNALITNLFRGMVGRALGFIGMGASFGLFAAPIASGFIGQEMGWRASCIAFALFGGVVAAAFGLIMPEEEPLQGEKDESRVPLRALAIALLPVILVFAMRDFCWWGTAYLTPAMTQMNLGFSKKAAGTLLGIMSVTGVLSQPFAGTLSDRLGRRRVISLALVLGGFSVYFFPYLKGVLLFGAAFVGGFMLLGTVPVVDAAAADIVPPRLRGRLFGVVMTLGLMVGALSPYVMGIIHDIAGDYQAAYLLLGTSALAGAALVFTISPQRVHTP